MRNADAPELFVGVDGGASKTHVVVIDAEGTTLGQASGPASSLATSAKAAFRIIEETVSGVPVIESRPRSALHLGVGVAGTEFGEERERFVTLCQQYGRVRVVSDAETACLGAHGGRDGAVVAIGTGVVGYRVADGNSRQVAGWGFPQDDRGGGAWVGLEAIHAVFRAVDGRAAHSPLTHSILAQFDEDPQRVVAWARSAGAFEFAAIARDVADFASSDDEHACAILDRAAVEIIAVARTLLDECRPDLPLALTGGLATTLTPWIRQTFGSQLAAVQYSAAHGAALMMRDAAVSERQPE